MLKYFIKSGIFYQLKLLRGSYFAFPSNDAENRKVEERKWQQHFFRFDDVQLAMLTLFTVATFEVSSLPP